MEKEFVSVVQNEALIALGFEPEDVFGWYDQNGVLHNYECADSVKAGLKQQVFKWFRKKHNLMAPIVNNGLDKFDFRIENGKHGRSTGVCAPFSPGILTDKKRVIPLQPALF